MVVLRPPTVIVSEDTEEGVGEVVVFITTRVPVEEGVSVTHQERKRKSPSVCYDVTDLPFFFFHS